jgi:hypothetical protein
VVVELVYPAGVRLEGVVRLHERASGAAEAFALRWVLGQTDDGVGEAARIGRGEAGHLGGEDL